MTHQSQTKKKGYNELEITQRQREEEIWHNTVSNLFGIYHEFYELFRKWHENIIEDRNVVAHSQNKNHSQNKLKEDRSSLSISRREKFIDK